MDVFSNETYQHFNVTHYHVHMIVIYFQGHGIKGQSQREHFPKMHFSAETHRLTVCRWRLSSFDWL